MKSELLKDQAFHANCYRVLTATVEASGYWRVPDLCPVDLKGAAANWRFQTEDARIKLRRLYPNIYG
jgi:hypothetical protein